MGNGYFGGMRIRPFRKFCGRASIVAIGVSGGLLTLATVASDQIPLGLTQKAVATWGFWTLLVGGLSGLMWIVLKTVEDFRDTPVASGLRKSAKTFFQFALNRLRRSRLRSPIYLPSNDTVPEGDWREGRVHLAGLTPFKPLDLTFFNAAMADVYPFALEAGHHANGLLMSLVNRAQANGEEHPLFWLGAFVVDRIQKPTSRSFNDYRDDFEAKRDARESIVTFCTEYKSLCAWIFRLSKFVGQPSPADTDDGRNWIIRHNQFGKALTTAAMTPQFVAIKTWAPMPALLPTTTDPVEYNDPNAPQIIKVKRAHSLDTADEFALFVHVDVRDTDTSFLEDWRLDLGVIDHAAVLNGHPARMMPLDSKPLVGHHKLTLMAPYHFTMPNAEALQRVEFHGVRSEDARGRRLDFFPPPFFLR